MQSTPTHLFDRLAKEYIASIEFVDESDKVKFDRGKRATILRGLRDDDTKYRAYEFLPEAAQDGTLSSDQVQAFLFVGAMYALTKKQYTLKPGLGDDARPNLGDAFKAYRNRQAKDHGTSAESAVVRHFNDLLNSNREDLLPRLKRDITLLHSHDIAIDWVRLLGDILRWNSHVKESWARSFWGGKNKYGGESATA